MSDDSRVEIWWPVHEHDDGEELGDRLTSIVERDVLPVLETKQAEEDLVALWKTGQSPLLVEAQRLLFLGQLLHRAGKHGECAEVKAELEQKAVDPFGLRALEKLRALGC